MDNTCLESTRKDTGNSLQPVKPERMSFIFPTIFSDMLKGLKKKYNKDMTYIVMEAVNEWVIRKENIKPLLVNNGGNKD